MSTTEPNVALEAARTTALADLHAATRRVTRRARAIEADLARIRQGQALAASASWLVVAAAKTPRGSTHIEGTDWSTGEAVALRVDIDPSRSARDQLQGIFKRAKRLAGGAAVATQRRGEANATAAILTAHAATVALAQTTDAIALALEDARRSAPGDLPRRRQIPGRSAKRDQALPPHRTFAARSGEPLWVGRGAARNDALTFQVARPHHLWMHARGVPGAHVIVPLVRGRACPADVLIDAAHLAAHFSDARGEAVVEIVTAPRKWVRKPKGAAPGAVIVEREKVITLRVVPEQLAALLLREHLG